MLSEMHFLQTLGSWSHAAVVLRFGITLDSRQSMHSGRMGSSSFSASSSSTTCSFAGLLLLLFFGLLEDRGSLDLVLEVVLEDDVRSFSLLLGFVDDFSDFLSLSFTVSGSSFDEFLKKLARASRSFWELGFKVSLELEGAISGDFGLYGWYGWEED